MNDIATDFKENSRIDVNDVLNDMQEDIQMVAMDVEDLKEEVARLEEAVNDMLNIVIKFVTGPGKDV